MEKEKKQVVLILDFQNIVEFLKSQEKTDYVPLFVSALKDISEEYGVPTLPRFAVPCHLLPESIIDSLRKIEDTECLIVKALPQLPGGIDQVDEIIKRMIKEAVNNEKVGTILLVSGDRDFDSDIQNANQNKEAIQISPAEMLEIFEKRDAKKIANHLQSVIESKKDPFPAILIKLQNNEAILPEEKRELTFLSLIKKALLNIYQTTEEVIPFNKLVQRVWDVLSPEIRRRDKIERQKFTYRHCRDALLAILAYTDLLNQDKRGVRCNLQSTLLSRLKEPA